MLFFALHYFVSGVFLLAVIAFLGFIVDVLCWLVIPWKTFGVRGVAIPEALSASFPALWALLFGYLTLKKKSVP